MPSSLSEKVRRKIQEVYSQIAREYDQTHQSAWRGFELFAPYIKRGGDVLDVGCGNGWLYGALHKKAVHYLGIDNSSALLGIARSRFPEGRFQFGDLVHLEIPEKSIDAVFALASLHHVQGRDLQKKAVDGIHRVLRDNGILVLTVWNLFHWRFLPQWSHSVFSMIRHCGLQYEWNDLWIPWRETGPKRFFHAFTPFELKTLFPKDQWRIEELYFTRKGARVQWSRSHNLCVVVRKIA